MQTVGGQYLAGFSMWLDCPTIRRLTAALRVEGAVFQRHCPPLRQALLALWQCLATAAIRRLHKRLPYALEQEAAHHIPAPVNLVVLIGSKREAEQLLLEGTVTALCPATLWAHLITLVCCVLL